MTINDNSNAFLHSLWPWVLLSLAIAVTVVIYYSGLSGPFIFDDFPNILNNEQIKLEKLTTENLRLAAFSTETGPLARPVAMFSFALNYYLFGADVYYFKLINLSIHCLNGILVFIFIRALLSVVFTAKGNGVSSDKVSLIAFLVASVWLVHPINLTSVLYVVQRMASLSATFVLTSLILYLKGRLFWRKGNRNHSYLYLAVAILSAVFGVFTKENALLLPFYLFLIEWLVLLPSLPVNAQKTLFWRSAIILLIIPIGSIAIYYLSKGIWQTGFDGRHFSLAERLLTESRILVSYLGMIVVPIPSEFSIYHDDIQVSVGLFSPWTTFASILFLVGLFIFVFRVSHRQPLFAFGIFFFFFAHLIESTIFALELMHEHRNYLASMGVLLALISGLVLFESNKYHVSKLIRYGLVTVFCCFFAVITHSRVLAWQDLNRLAMTELENHPDSARAHYQAALVFTSLGRNDIGEVSIEYKQKAIDQFLISANLNTQSDAAGLLAAIFIYGLEDRGDLNTLSSMLSGNQLLAPSLDIPENVYERALESLRTDIITEEAVVSLVRMSSCERSKDCYFPEGVIDSMFAGLMENPRLIEHSIRAAVLLEEMSLRKLQANELDSALSLVRRAIEINPHMAMYKIHGAEIFSVAGDIDTAKMLIHEVLSRSQPEAIRKLARDILESLETKEAIKQQ